MRDTTVWRLRISKHICLLLAVLVVVVVVVVDDCRQRSPEVDPNRPPGEQATTTYVFRPPLDSVVAFSPQLVVEEAVEEVDLEAGARGGEETWQDSRRGETLLTWAVLTGGTHFFIHKSLESSSSCFRPLQKQTPL